MIDGFRSYTHEPDSELPLPPSDITLTYVEYVLVEELKSMVTILSASIFCSSFALTTHVIDMPFGVNLILIQEATTAPPLESINPTPPSLIPSELAINSSIFDASIDTSLTLEARCSAGI